MKNILGNSNFGFTKWCIALIAALMTFATTGWGQSYYDMSSGNYSQPFTGISATWPTNWGAVAVVSTGSIPAATKTTATSASPATISSSTAIGQDAATSTKLVFLTTGTTDSTASIACDLNLNFAGRSAGNLSFDVGEINNSTGDRVSTLKVYYSDNGTNWTEMTGTNLPFVATNNVGKNASINVALPASLNNKSTVKLRFYCYNGSGGTTGSRPKIGIDNVAVTSTSATPSLTAVTLSSAISGSSYGTASSGVSFTASGSNLTGNITATAQTGYEVSTSQSSGYGTSVSVASGTAVWVRYAATQAAGAYNGVPAVVLSGGGASSNANVTTSASGNSVGTVALTITGLTAENKNWDNTTTASVTGTPTFSGLVNGDNLTPEGLVTWAFADANVGTNKTLNRTGIYTVSSANYTVTQPTLTGSIAAVVPSVPAISTITAGDGQLSVAFTPPTSSGGASITDYKYSLDGGALVSVGSSTSSPFIITGLTNGQLYAVQLYAVNSAGDSLTSSAVNGTPLAPSSPTITVAPATFGSAFSTTYGTASSTQNFRVSGSALNNDLTVTAPTGFEVSRFPESGYADSLNLTSTSGSVASTTIYTRLKATASAGSYNDLTFTIVSTGAPTQNVVTTLSGNVVGQAALTITGIGIANKVYDRTTTVTISGTAEYVGLQNGESFSVTGTPSASFATATVGLAKPVDVTGYTAPNSNYTLTQPTFAADISAVALTVTGATVTPKSYDGNTVATINGATLSGVISPDVVTLTGGTSGTFVSANVGTGIAVSTTMGITGADAGNYSFTAPTGLVGEITKATAVITFASLPSGKKVGDSAFSAGATTTAGTLSYSSSNPNVATIDGSGNITPVAPGVTTITVSVAGTANYNAAAPASQTLNVAGTAPSLTVLSENFASLTAGNDTSTTGQSSALSGTSLANFPTVSSAYSAGGAVKLGVSGGTGSITSKTLDLSGNGGNYTVTFKVKGWTTVEGSIIVTPSVGSSQTVSYTAVMGGSYETKTLAFTGGTSSMTLSFATSAKRAFLDDIVVTTAGASTPAITPSGSFSALSTTYGAASGPSATTVAVTGGSLTADILATAPPGFEVSNDGTSYGATATFAQTSGFANGTLYLRLAANAPVGSNSGNVVLSSTGATPVNVATATSTVTNSAGNPLQAYMANFGLSGTDAAGTADPDGDGMDNNAEFAFGTSPVSGASRAVTQESVVGGIKIKWLQRSGINYTVKSTDNLGSTFSGTVSSSPVSPQPGGLGDYQQYEATLTGGDRGFLKVEAIVP